MGQKLLNGDQPRRSYLALLSIYRQPEKSQLFASFYVFLKLNMLMTVSWLQKNLSQESLLLPEDYSLSICSQQLQFASALTPLEHKAARKKGSRKDFLEPRETLR